MGSMSWRQLRGWTAEGMGFLEAPQFDRGGSTCLPRDQAHSHCSDCEWSTSAKTNQAYLIWSAVLGPQSSALERSLKDHEVRVQALRCGRLAVPCLLRGWEGVGPEPFRTGGLPGVAGRAGGRRSPCCRPFPGRSASQLRTPEHRRTPCCAMHSRVHESQRADLAAFMMAGCGSQRSGVSTTRTYSAGSHLAASCLG